MSPHPAKHLTKLFSPIRFASKASSMKNKGFSEGSLHPLDQFQSPLFEKLPVEIREIMWGYALDYGEPLHMVQREIPRNLLERRFFGTRKPSRRFHIADCERFIREWHGESFARPTSDVPHGACYLVFSPELDYGTEKVDTEPVPTLSRERFQPLSLLRTCRRIYLEAANILYSANAFEFYLGTGVRAFMHALPAPRVAAIRSLAFYADIHNSERTRANYEIALQVAKSCPGLCKLRILIYDYIGDLLDEHSPWFVEQLNAECALKEGLWVENLSEWLIDEPREGSSSSEGGQSGEESNRRRRRQHFGRFEKRRVE